MEKAVKREAETTADDTTRNADDDVAAPPPAKRIKMEDQNGGTDNAKTGAHVPDQVPAASDAAPVPGPLDVIVDLLPQGTTEANGNGATQEVARGYRFTSPEGTPQVTPFTMYDAIHGPLRVIPLRDAPRLTIKELVRSRDGPGLPLWTQVHLRAGARAILWLEVEAGGKLASMCNEAHAQNAVYLAQSGPEMHSDAFQVCLVPKPPQRKRPEASQEEGAAVKTEEAAQVKTEDNDPPSAQGPVGFLVYAVPNGTFGEEVLVKNENGKDASTSIAPLPSRFAKGILSHAQLGLVLGVEHTLSCIYDLTFNKPPRETELAMLQEFDNRQRVSLAGGTQIMAQMEDTWLDDLAVQEDALVPEPEAADAPTAESASLDKQHPVVRLSSAEGELVLTKIAYGPNGSFVRSILVHIRPGWPELRRYILNNQQGPNEAQQQQQQGAAKESASSSSPTSSSSSLLFRVFACCKQARSRREALELWRLLDPDSELLVDTGGLSSTRSRLYSHATAPERSITAALEAFPCEHQVTMAVDNSTRWFGRSGLAKVWPVRPYEPYSGNLDTGLAAVLHAVHAIRNMFYERCDLLSRELSGWLRQLDAEGNVLGGLLVGPQPSVPDLMQLVQFQKHRWLQEFQAPQTRGVPPELAAAKDFADPILRSKWHIVVDTNVLHHCASDRFEFFKTLEHTHGDSIVMVIPFATVHELDWQKHHVKDPVKLANATASIRYLNSQVAAGSRFIVMQSVSEDAPHAAKHKHVKPFNAQNDMRVFECANSRVAAGMRTLVLSGDTNLRNVCMSANVPAVRFQPLWGMLNNANYQRLSPEHWLRALQKIEQDKQARLQKRHANQLSLKS
ncbi:RNA polymerase II C-terminal domain phosphatase-like 2 [Hondaea fermentalgiana]|uniref:RNA polymerase II C-terminal domain phosphatase-like 2 n=1 Tax=Hondaea fermentalgiana TaxID=2315210 RepID=A0A2R5FYH4_9STRA|nr:RNA polymerase II C-terminal domain phosphatase-like 2 [Hondaea fermentalgiana]|eukprot:GBG23807.1 RNA polymerase II C-terminal domain phosphatase-like 2 [Hondaea fermentalgiana]